MRGAERQKGNHRLHRLAQRLTPRAPRTPRNAKGAKDKNHRLHRLAQIFSVFSVNFCVLCGFNHSIGVNLCQSVDGNAKDAKNTKDAKVNAEAQRKQRTQREVFFRVFPLYLRRNNPTTQRLNPSVPQSLNPSLCVLCKFLCPLWLPSSIGVNLCQSVDKTNHRLAQITPQRPNDPTT